MKVFLDTVGCRLNQAEIEELATRFIADGHIILPSAEGADMVVVNSCAVTAAAASDSRQKSRQAYRSGAKKIVFTGCLATIEPQESGQLSGVTHVISNENKMAIPSLISEGQTCLPLDMSARQPLPGIHKKTRAYLKVQDGCDNYCSYCITRIARGKATSVPKADVLKAVLFAEAGGVKEVVLTGVNLVSWGQDFEPGETLTDLVQHVLRHSSIERLRLSSTEPWGLDEKFLSLWLDPRMCRHLHFPLQSGSDAVLRRMGRQITKEKYRILIETARNFITGLAVTTDIIVGFPGETEDEFEESLRFVKELKFAGGHVFRYSARPGTAAERMGEILNGSIVAERAKRMREVIESSKGDFSVKFIGSPLSVLWEVSEPLEGGRWKVHGWSDNYLQVQADSDTERNNQVDQVCITKLGVEGVRGEIVEGL